MPSRRPAFSTILYLSEVLILRLCKADAHSMCSDTGVDATRSCIQRVGRCSLCAPSHDSRSCASSTSNTDMQYPRLSRQRGARGGVYESKQEEAKKFEETTDEPLSSEPRFVQQSSLLHANEASRQHDYGVDAKGWEFSARSNPS